MVAVLVAVVALGLALVVAGLQRTPVHQVPPPATQVTSVPYKGGPAHVELPQGPQRHRTWKA